MNPPGDPPDASHGAPPRRRRILRASLAVLLGFLPLAAAEVACIALGWGGSAIERYFAFLPDFYLRSGGLAEFVAKKIPPRDDPQAFRILCLGGSTTAGYPYEGVRSFPAELQAALEHVLPGVPWEVQNAGHNGWSSTHVRGVVDPSIGGALAASDANLVIVCCGHNEFLDRLQHRVPWFGGGWRSGLIRLAMYSRLFGRLRFGLRGRPGDYLASRRRSRERGPADLTLLDRPHLDRPVQENLPMQPWERERHLQRFRENLGAIVDTCVRAGRAVVLCTLTSGTRDVEPMRSEPLEPLDPARLREIRRDLDAAWGKLGKEGTTPAAAREVLDLAGRALAIDTGYAESHFVRGRALLAMGRDEEARGELETARDLDAAPLRAPSDVVGIVREVARERGVALFDVEALFRDHAPAGCPGREWIVDSLHPNARGYRLFGLSLAAFLLREEVLEASPTARDRGLQWIQDRVAALDANPSPIPPEGGGDPAELRESHDRALVSDAAFLLLFGNPGATGRLLEGIPESGSLRRRPYRRALLLQAILAKGRGDPAFVREARERLIRADPRVRARARQEMTRKILGIERRHPGGAGRSRRRAGKGKGRHRAGEGPSGAGEGKGRRHEHN